MLAIERGLLSYSFLCHLPPAFTVRAGQIEHLLLISLEFHDPRIDIEEVCPIDVILLVDHVLNLRYQLKFPILILSLTYINGLLSFIYRGVIRFWVVWKEHFHFRQLTSLVVDLVIIKWLLLALCEIISPHSFVT